MSREIKFRMVYQTTGEIIGYTDAYRLLRNGDDELPDYEKAILHGVSFEQYTGLTDKNGKEIYEGDIITETIDDGSNKIIQIYEVYWDENMLDFGIRGTKGFNYNLHDELWQTNASREVIGNIHESPELLGGDE